MMHVLLAGQLAEKELLASNSMGADNDMNRWKALAVRYLSNYFDSATYTIHPTTPEERQRNEECIDQLLTQQRNMTQTLIRTNLSVINCIVEHLQAYSTIGADTMAQLLSNTSLPDDFPRYQFTKSRAIGTSSRTSSSASDAS
jgi:ATP-dependent Zn protease